MLYDAVEQAYTVLAANFATDYATLLTAKGVTSPGTVTLIKRQTAETALRLGKAPPFIGVVGIAAQTQAKSNAIRPTKNAIVYDIYLTNADPVLVAKQVELAAEAALMSMDRIAGSGGGAFNAAGVPLEATIELDDAFIEAPASLYERRAKVMFPLWDHDAV